MNEQTLLKIILLFYGESVTSERQGYLNSSGNCSHSQNRNKMNHTGHKIKFSSEKLHFSGKSCINKILVTIGKDN